MTKRTKSKAITSPLSPLPNTNTIAQRSASRENTAQGLYLHPPSPSPTKPVPPETHLTRPGPQIRRLAPQTGQEDGNQPARPLHVHLLRQDDGQETQRRHLELPELQEDRRGRRVDGVVSGPFNSPLSDLVGPERLLVQVCK